MHSVNRRNPAMVLPVIVLSQFCCTSLWFAGNGVMDELVRNFQLHATALGHLTAAVQFGFIAGTLLFALLTVSDRFSPSLVFFVCAMAGALFNLGMSWNGNGMNNLMFFRFTTGFFLAGIYPVGMKIASDYYQKGLDKSLGFLVGALVVGTALPHLLKGLTLDLPWKSVLIIISILAALGGILMLLAVPDGPFRKPGQKFDPGAVPRVFGDRAFRSAAFGYFGHMWELYAFWAFVPVMITFYISSHTDIHVNVPLYSFIVIATGGVACILGGYISQRMGTRRTAATSLLLSCLCCLLSPVMLRSGSFSLFIVFLIFWGMVVIADSPLFSTLVARNSPAESRGTALTIVTSIGFAITIFSIQLLTSLEDVLQPAYLFIWLGIGPVLGLIALWKRDAGMSVIQ